jgi:Replication initiator protein, pSAM2
MSTATFAPGAPVAPGAGAAADPRFSGHRSAVDRLDVSRALLVRAGRGDYWRWLAHVAPAAGCTRPIRLAGELQTVDTRTGEVTETRATAGMPDAVIYKACGDRRAAVCPYCAEVYRADAYQLVLAGLRGGKGVPESVAGHPAVFVTLTAPSFGLVHSQRTHRRTGTPRPCHPWPAGGGCPHGAELRCRVTHQDGDARLGQPLCHDCYDYDGQAIWNAHAAELWRRTTIALARGIRRHARAHGGPPVRVSFGKAAEYQRRGVVHFHALIRLDGVDPVDLGRVVPPPAWATVLVLAQAVRDAVIGTRFSTPPHPDCPDGWHIAWGDPDNALDIRPLRLSGGAPITEDAVAAYLAKYATKTTEATGYASKRITAETIGMHAGESHIGRLVAACWRLGRRPARRPGEARPAYVIRARRWAKTAYPGLRRWAHHLGYGGHFFTKSRRYSTTFGALRAARASWRRARFLEHDQAAEHAAETAVVVTALAFVGIGWHTIGDALLANTAAALARERRQAARDAAIRAA